MKVTTIAELHALPPGTVYCCQDDGYAVSLDRKGESYGSSFAQRELLPQPNAGPARRPGGSCWMPETVREFDSDPGNHNDAGDVVFVLEEADLDRLAVLIGRGPGWVTNSIPQGSGL